MSKNFYFENPIEKTLEKKEEKEQNIEKLKSFIEKISSNLNQEKIPVNKEGRINLDAFDKIYPKSTIEKDKTIAKELEQQKWYKGLSEAEIEKEKPKRTGEQLEMLKTAILYKNLHKDFIVARASSYDDINGVDNVILEKDTGNTICALDEVSEISGEIFRKKEKNVLDKNREGGGKLKYGIKLEEGEISIGEVKNLPLFYLALPQKYVEKGMEELIPSLEENSEYGKNIFNWFVSSIDSQIKSLKLEPNLNKELYKRILCFEKTIQKFKN
ncbi:MAG: hypothetical protein U9P88_00785 [Patescibacteria group bacterium]|nr:hypothetical protein [Patescibacteria group bacterium]